MFAFLARVVGGVAAVMSAMIVVLFGLAVFGQESIQYVATAALFPSAIVVLFSEKLREWVFEATQKLPNETISFSLRSDGVELNEAITAFGEIYHDPHLQANLSEYSTEEAIDFIMPQPSIYSTFGKRLLDIVLVLWAAPIVLPVVFIMALFASWDGGRPFYSQLQLGAKGRIYRAFKIRTMVLDADEVFGRAMEKSSDLRAEWMHNGRLKYDPRITRLGAFLRGTSLDELPMFWNVLLGDMSFVGPLPGRVRSEVEGEKFGGYPFAIRPGITGPFQISDRDTLENSERGRIEMNYCKSMSLWGDLVILTRTTYAVLRIAK